MTPVELFGQFSDSGLKTAVFCPENHAENVGRKNQRGFCKPPKTLELCGSWLAIIAWLRGTDLNRRPLDYEPNELPDCSTPR